MLRLKEILLKNLDIGRMLTEQKRQNFLEEAATLEQLGRRAQAMDELKTTSGLVLPDSIVTPFAKNMYQPPAHPPPAENGTAEASVMIQTFLRKDLLVCMGLHSRRSASG